MAQLAFDILQGDIRVPTVAVETDLNSGRTGVPSETKKLLLVGYGLAAGSASNGEVHQIFDEASARALWGAGSVVSVMAERAMGVSARIPIYGMSFAENGAAVAATGTLTITGTATGSGTLTSVIGGRVFRAGVQTGDTPTVIGDAIVAKINAAVNAPFTAANVTGTVTITARNKGSEGNTIRHYHSVNAAAVSVTPLVSTAFASGATPGDPTSVLAGIEGDRYHIIALGVDDATNAGALQAHQEARSNPLEQKWGYGVVGSTGNSAAAVALAAALDSYRMDVVWQESAEQPVYEIIAAMAAERARIVRRSQSLNSHVLPGLVPQTLDTVWPNSAEEEAALANGVTPLRPLRNGTVQIIRNINTRVTDPAFIDNIQNEISDYIDEDFITQMKRRYPDAALKVASPAGTESVLTPLRVLAVYHERMRIWDEELDYIQGADAIIKAKLTQALPNMTDPNRLDIGAPFQPVFSAHVIALLKRFTVAKAA